MERGFGVAGSVSREIVREVARAVEVHGYHAFWANDTPQGDGLAALAEAARVTERVRLGVGVIALDRRPAEKIVARIRELGLPEDRLTLGIGSGGARKGTLDLVRTNAQILEQQTSAKVVVGALGPKMLRLSGAATDGVLLNWLTPEFAKDSAKIVRAAADESGKPAPLIAGYVRVALGGAAEARLKQEAARYAALPQYAAHFARMGVEAIATCVTGDTRNQLQAGLGLFAQVLDATVVRAITAEETAAAYLALVQAAAPE